MPRFDTIQVHGRPMRVYLDLPEHCTAGAARPGVLVMIHGPGLDRFIEAQVEALAHHGYVAAAPDLFHRQPDDGADTMARVGRLRDPEILADADATVAHLQGMEQVRADALAVLGFCMGGRHAYLLAGARPATWKAAGVFYGGNSMKAWGDGPSPFDLTPQIDCPVAGFFGADDTNPCPDDVKRLDAELTRHGKAHDFTVYQGAGHAFLNFTNPDRHRPGPAADAWAKMLAFLDRHLARAP